MGIEITIEQDGGRYKWITSAGIRVQVGDIIDHDFEFGQSEQGISATQDEAYAASKKAIPVVLHRLRSVLESAGEQLAKMVGEYE